MFYRILEPSYRLLRNKQQIELDGEILPPNQPIGRLQNRTNIYVKSRFICTRENFHSASVYSILIVINTYDFFDYLSTRILGHPTFIQ